MTAYAPRSASSPSARCSDGDSGGPLICAVRPDEEHGPNMQLDAWQEDHDDRRASPRQATRIDATLEHPAGTLAGRVVDISFGGANFVTETVAPVLEIGCDVVLTVVANADAIADQLSWAGTLLRCERSGDDGPDRIAYAIEFDESAAGAIPDIDALD